MARKVSKAGKGGGDAFAKVEEVLSKVTEGDKNLGTLEVGVDTSTFNSYTQNMKTELSKAYVKASSRIESELSGALLDNIETPMWPWPRFTNRVSGGQVSSPRDIVDTQELQDRNKIKASFTVKGFKLSITNSAKYSGIVYYGGYVGGNLSGARGTYIPGRPWIAVSLGIPPTRGAGPVSMPSGGGTTVVDWQGIINDEVKKAIERATRNTAG